MQRQARLPEFFDQIGQNTLFWDKVQKGTLRRMLIVCFVIRPEIRVAMEK